MMQWSFFRPGITDFARLIKPHQFFFTVGLIYGFSMLMMTPPFQVPDEINHWYRAYQISTGHLLAEKHNNRLGGILPKGVVEITNPFLGLRWNINAKTGLSTIKEQCSINLQADQQVFNDFPNTALYSPISYLPQSISIYLSRSLGLNPMSIFYFTRIMTLFLWLVAITYAVRITPIFKWLLALLALLPMSIFINMSLSADMVTNTLSFLLIAFSLRCAFNDQLMSPQKFLIFFILGICLASAKIVYTPLIFLIFIIPGHRYRSQFFRWSFYISILLSSFATAYLWTSFTKTIYIPYEFYNPAFRDTLDLVKCGGIQEQMDYILSHDTYLIRVFIHSLYRTFNMYYEGYIGTFGWLDTRLPDWSILITYMVIIAASFFPVRENLTLTPFQRIILLGVVLGTTALVLLSQHLTWDCIGSDVIGTIQGRYFIPVFPLLFFVFRTKVLRFSQIIPTIIMTWLLFLLTFSTATLYHRYFVAPVFKEFELRCGAEAVVDGYLETSVKSVMLENADTRSRESCRSGNYALKLNADKPYGFTFRSYNAKAGDVIKVSVWKLGQYGSIVLSGDGGKSFYKGSSTSRGIDERGWEELSITYTLQDGLKGRELGIYIFNNHDASSYFDDLEILIAHQ
ncbi:MAG: DUF2142 domain-containing protein [Saprospiraceae bacterium]|nr:DUF2142 domain-containing protein [Saprospiraceae bacterium]